jgi:hypothetical protein
MVACHLLKWIYYNQDTEGHDTELRYFRDVDKREVDFVLVLNKKPIHFIECKLSGKSVSLSLKYLKKRFPKVPATQVILEGDVDWVTKEGIRVCSAHHFLKDFQ